jgi:hypothetical protein
LAKAVRSDTSGPCDERSGVRLAAMTCGIPDPRACGTQRSVAHVMTAKIAGLANSGA